jgi:ankyrin repeat protein
LTYVTFDVFFRMPGNQHMLDDILQSLIWNDDLDGVNHRLADTSFSSRQCTDAVSMAIEMNRPVIVKELLKEGATPDLSYLLNAALRLAVEYGDRDLIKFLVGRGAQVYGGLLLLAIQKRHTEAAEELLELGADPNATDYKGQTPLMMAVRTRNTRILKRLLEVGADLLIKDNRGRTVYDRARFGERYESLALLPPEIQNIASPDGV